MFEPHCEYTIELDGTVMITVMSGAWNIEGTRQYVEDVKKSAQSLVGSPWCRIADLRGFDGGPIEIMDELVDLQAWSREKGCASLVLVAPKSLNKRIIDSKEPVYPDVHQADSIAQAVQMAREILSPE